MLRNYTWCKLANRFVLLFHNAITTIPILCDLYVWWCIDFITMFVLCGCEHNKSMMISIDRKVSMKFMIYEPAII